MSSVLGFDPSSIKHHKIVLEGLPDPGGGCKHHPKTFINPCDQSAQYERRDREVRDTDKQRKCHGTTQTCSKWIGSKSNEVRSGRGNADFGAGTCRGHGKVYGASERADYQTPEAESAVIGGTVSRHEVAPYPAYCAKYETEEEEEEIGLVGTGEAREHCGEIRYLVSCTKELCEHKELRALSCGRAECEQCYTTWAARGATRIAERFEGYKEAYDREIAAVKGVRRLGNPLHVSISAPESLYEEIKKNPGFGRREAQKIARLNGVRSGTIEYHAYRIIPEIKQELRRYRDMDAIDASFYDLIREDVLNLGSWKKYLYFSPHYHGIVHARKEGKEVREAVYKRTGWVYRVIPREENGKKKYYLENSEAIHRVAYYILDHAALIPGFNAVSFFGGMAFNQMVIDRLRSWFVWDYERCPLCSSPLEKTDLETEEKRECLLKIKHTFYHLKFAPEDQPPPWLVNWWKSCHLETVIEA